MIKMLWISNREYSFQSIYYTLVHLKKFVAPLLAEGENSLSKINFKRIERWIEEETTDIDFENEKVYAYINKLFVEKEQLPFRVALSKRLTPDDFSIRIAEKEQYSVIPQRLYFRALSEAELLIERLYPLRDELEALSTYLTTFNDKIYEGYAKYLYQGMKTSSNGRTIWRLSNGRDKVHMEKNQAFKAAFNALKTPTKDRIMMLIREHKPTIHPSSYAKLHPGSVISIDGREITNSKQATVLLTEYCGGCIWALLAKSGMRVDEAFHLHTVNGCQKEIISEQVIHVLNANLSKTVRGSQSKQDEFVTTELGMKAFEVLQSIHKPLREYCTDSKHFFHTLKLMDGFRAAGKSAIATQAQKWFNKTLASDINLTKEDIRDLQISNPNRSYKIGEEYKFSCHQLRRTFAYYLIGYELLS
ncbi:site-specific integrase, partial [Vibrio sp. M260118]